MSDQSDFAQDPKLNELVESAPAGARSEMEDCEGVKAESHPESLPVSPVDMSV